MFASWACLILGTVIFLCLSCILAGEYASECSLTLIPPMHLLLLFMNELMNELTSDECNRPQLSSYLTSPKKHCGLLLSIANGSFYCAHLAVYYGFSPSSSPFPSPSPSSFFWWHWNPGPCKC